MVKLYKPLMVLALSVIALAANAVNITVNIDEPARVKVLLAYVEQTVVAGDNVFDAEEYSQLSIESTEGNLLKSVVRKSDGSSEYVTNMTSCGIYISSYYEGETWTVTSAPEAEVRTAVCHVTVDEAAKVRMQRSGSYSTVVLADGFNDVRYAPETETQLMIAAVNYGTSLYKVTQNGTPVEPSYGSYTITLTGEDNIEILANFPEVYYPVHFVYADEESKGFITDVTVDGTPATNYNDADFTARMGSMVSITGNLTDYVCDEIAVNGEPQYYSYGSINVNITGETTISVKAHKYGTISATLNIDDPSHIKVYRGYSYNNDLVSGLVSGDNTIELNETNTMLCIAPESGCYITSMVDNEGTSYNADYSGYYNITVKDGMTITITSGAISRDSKAIVYIDDRSAAATYFSFTRNDRSEVALESGYNTVEFYSGDNPMGLSWYGAPYANVYLNDATVSPMYEGSTTYQFEFADGDVLKIYLASNPKTCGVTFTVGDGVNAGSISVKRDLVKTVDNWADGVSVLEGTQFDITAGEAVVAVDGETVAPEDGVVTFVVNADTEVKFSTPSGINDIHAADKTTRHEVYNMQGVKVLDSVDGATVNSLPAGIYIVDGKKIVVR